LQIDRDTLMFLHRRTKDASYKGRQRL